MATQLTPAQATSIQNSINSIQAGINQVASSRGVSLVQRPGSSGQSSSDWSTVPIQKPETPQIPAETLNTNNPANSKITIPNLLTKDYTGLNQALSSTNPDGTPKDTNTQIQELQNNQTKQFQTYLDNISTAKPPSAEDAYAKAQEQTQIKQKQQTVNDLTTQLNQITATGQANQLAVTGQGRGIPEAIIGGQQAQIAKETAIQALPVSALLQAAQGNLASAEQSLQTLFKIYYDDATNNYNYKTKVNESIYTFLTGQEKTKMDQIQKQDDRNYNALTKTIDFQNDLAKTALSTGQSALFTAITALKPSDPNYQTRLGQLGSQIKAKVTSTQASTNDAVNFQRIISGVSDIKNLSQSDRTAVENKLWADGYYKEVAPSWFKSQVEQNAKQSFAQEAINQMWNEYRQPIIDRVKTSLTSTGGDDDIASLITAITKK